MSDKSKKNHLKIFSFFKKYIKKNDLTSIIIAVIAILVILGSGILIFILTQQKPQKSIPKFVNLEQKKETKQAETKPVEDNPEVKKLNELLINKNYDKLDKFTEVMLPPNAFPVGIVDVDKKTGWKLGYETTLATPLQSNGKRQAIVQNVSNYTTDGIQKIQLSKSELKSFEKKECSGIGDECVVYFRSNPDNIDTYRLYFKQGNYLVYFEYAGENTIIDNNLDWLRNIALQVSKKVS